MTTMATPTQSTEVTCEIAPTIDVIFGRWSAPILWHLRYGTSLRFTELRNSLPGVSPKVLTQRLRQLETDGLVTRTYHAEMPPRVEYAATPLAETLEPVFTALSAWSAQHLGEVLAARDAAANQQLPERFPVGSTVS